MKKQELVTIALGVVAFFGCNIRAQEMSNDVSIILRASLSAQSGTAPVRDAILNGTAKYTRGSDEETVPFEFKATSSGGSRTDIHLPGGAAIEIHKASPSGKSGSWSRGAGTKHSISGHNLIGDPTWYLPVLVVERFLTDKGAIVSYLGNEEGLAHFQSVSKPVPGIPLKAASHLQHLSQVDLYLDPKTLFPLRLKFNLHPDDNSTIDIPVSVEYSEYKAANGVTSPSRIQKYVNNCLALDAQVQSATFNSGLNQESFDLQ